MEAPTDPTAAAALVSALAEKLERSVLGRVGSALVRGGVDFDQVGANGYTALAWAATSLCRLCGDDDADGGGTTTSSSSGSSSSSSSSRPRAIFEMMLLLARFVTARANVRALALAQEKALADERAQAAAEARAEDASDADEEGDAFDANTGRGAGAATRGAAAVALGTTETDDGVSEYSTSASED